MNNQLLSNVKKEGATTLLFRGPRAHLRQANGNLNFPSPANSLALSGGAGARTVHPLSPVGSTTASVSYGVMKNFMNTTSSAFPSGRYDAGPSHRNGYSKHHETKSTRNEYMTQGGFTFENNIPVLTAFGEENSTPSR